MPRHSSTRRSRQSTGRRSSRRGATRPADAGTAGGRPPVGDVLQRLRAFYGALTAPPAMPFAAYVWEVLSVGTTPARRDAAFNAFKRLPALTADAVARVPQAKLEAAVALAGPMKDERVRALRAGADVFRRDPALLDDLAGPPRGSLRAIRRIPHLGRAASVRMLLFSRSLPVLPLDEHALRVARRLGYGAGQEDAPAVRLLRMARQALMRDYGHDAEVLKGVAQYFSHHGISTCTERTPHCSVCPLAHQCEWLRHQ